MDDTPVKSTLPRRVVCYLLYSYSVMSHDPKIQSVTIYYNVIYRGDIDRDDKLTKVLELDAHGTVTYQLQVSPTFFRMYFTVF